MEDFKTFLISGGYFDSSELENIPDHLNEPLHYWLLRNFPHREFAIWESLARYLHIDIIRSSDVSYNNLLSQLLPARVAHEYIVAPVSIDGSRITLAMADPSQFDKCDEIGMMMNPESLPGSVSRDNLEVSAVLACPQDLTAIIKRIYGIGAETVADVVLENYYSISENDYSDISINQTRIDAGVDDYHDAAIVRFVNQLIVEAIKNEASDIHLEPYESTFQIRYRIDGILQTEPVPANIKNLEAAVISRIKIMANLNIAEKRLPQDGQIRLIALGRPIDVRVSVIPTMFGQSIVLRLLDKQTAFIRIDQLGLSEENQNKFYDAITTSHGVILVTGPTGSGKSTTLYSLLNEIDRHNRKVITVEDPIEYQLENVSQIQVKPDINLNFATCLRSILRHDPDIIMIGEIRDDETARIAISSAMTGHLVLSTLHTNDATSAPVRLLEMGIEPYLAASALEVIAAQRLVRKLCLKCRQKVPVNHILKEQEAAVLIDSNSIYQPIGCEHCRETGYKGRTAIFEIFSVDETISNMIIEKANAAMLRNAACNSGMQTLLESGLSKVNDGITSLSEIYRVVKQ